MGFPDAVATVAAACIRAASLPGASTPHCFRPLQLTSSQRVRTAVQYIRTVRLRRHSLRLEEFVHCLVSVITAYTTMTFRHVRNYYCSCNHRPTAANGDITRDVSVTASRSTTRKLHLKYIIRCVCIK